jgi:superoxide reductase
MTKIHEVYKCDICGNIVEVLHSGVGELVCCGQSMTLQTEKVQEEGSEKHVPVIADGKVSVPHPMEENHYIEWIETTSQGKISKKFFQPGDEAVVEGQVDSAREYCNIHGLWSTPKN